MTQPHITLSHLKKHLKNCSQEELIDEISELFRRFPVVKKYYQIKLYPESEEQVITKYKKAIEDEFLPSKGFNQSMHKTAKKAISEYKKVSQTPLGLVDIMLFYVEQGIKFTNTCSDVDEIFYISMEGMYEKAVAFISKNGFKDIFQERCQKIVEDTSDIGWGFHDALHEIYQEAF